MKLTELAAIVENDNQWVKKYTGLHFAKNTAGERLWTLIRGEHWAAVLVLGGKKNSDGVPMCYTEGFTSRTTYDEYKFIRNRMIERYREAVKTGVWKPMLDQSEAA